MEEPALIGARFVADVGRVRTTRDGGAAAASALPEIAVAGARLSTDHFWPAAGVSIVPRVCVE